MGRKEPADEGDSLHKNQWKEATHENRAGIVKGSN